MSKVHCGTVLTSNVTNNFFLQSRCSNPFSGFWNGNIITFLWCSAFDKTGLGWTSDWVGCLSKALSSQYFTSLTYSLTHSAPSLSFLLSHSIVLSVISKKVILALSPPPHTQVLQWIKEALSTLLMAPLFRRLMSGVYSPLWLAQMDWCRRSHWAVTRSWTSAR